MDPLQHAPSNQSVPLVDYDVAAADQARLAGDWAGTFDTLPRGLDLPGIAARTTPHLD